VIKVGKRGVRYKKHPKKKKGARAAPFRDNSSILQTPLERREERKGTSYGKDVIPGGDKRTDVSVRPPV